jgi:hypothetical protein
MVTNAVRQLVGDDTVPLIQRTCALCGPQFAVESRTMLRRACRAAWSLTAACTGSCVGFVYQELSSVAATMSPTTWSGLRVATGSLPPCDRWRQRGLDLSGPERASSRRSVWRR